MWFPIARGILQINALVLKTDFCIKEWSWKLHLKSAASICGPTENTCLHRPRSLWVVAIRGRTPWAKRDHLLATITPVMPWPGQTLQHVATRHSQLFDCRHCGVATRNSQPSSPSHLPNTKHNTQYVQYRIVLYLPLGEIFISWFLFLSDSGCLVKILSYNQYCTWLRNIVLLYNI